MTTQVSEHWTNERCRRGALIKVHTEYFYVQQQDEPFETTTERLCCAACEAEGN